MKHTNALAGKAWIAYVMVKEDDNLLCACEYLCLAWIDHVISELNAFLFMAATVPGECNNDLSLDLCNGAMLERRVELCRLGCGKWILSENAHQHYDAVLGRHSCRHQIHPLQP